MKFTGKIAGENEDLAITIGKSPIKIDVYSWEHHRTNG
jgi:hypothetical protein